MTQTEPVGPDLIEHALHYARAGYPVFPLGDAGTAEAKRPRVAWRDAATTDLGTVRTWWERWPRANIGMPTGSASGVYVVDIDNDHGWDWLGQWERGSGGRLHTAEVQTGRPDGTGGHLWFRWQEGLRNSASKIATGIDERGEGGYVVLPPSIHDKAPHRPYAWRDRSPALPWAPDRLEDPPPAWLDLALRREPSEPTARAALEQWSDWREKSGARTYLDAALESACDNVAGAPEGARNHRLNEEAFNLGQLENRGLSRAEAEARLGAAARSAGLHVSEVRATFESGWNAGTRTPRPERERTLHSLTGRYEPPRPGPPPELEEEDPGWWAHYEWALGELATQAERGVVEPQETGWLIDLLDMEFPPTPWVVDGLVVGGSVTMLAAAPKVSKTWVGLEILVSLVTGQKVFGKFRSHRPEKPCFAFLAEDGKHPLKNRVRALFKGKGVDPRPLRKRLAYSSMNRLDLKSPESAAATVADILTRCPEGVSVLYIDPLRNVHSGEENASDDMYPIMDRLHRIARMLDCTVILSHHLRKGGKASVDFRGSEAVRGALSGYLVMVEDEAKSQPGYLASKVTEVKCKGVRPAGAFNIALEIDDNEKGEAVRATWEVYERAGKGKTKADAREAVINACRELSAGGPFTATAVASLSEVHRNSVTKHLSEIPQALRLEGSKHAKWRWDGD